MERLDSDTQSIDPDGVELSKKFEGGIFWIGLKGDFAIFRWLDPGDDLGHRLGTVEGGGSAAKIDRGDLYPF